MELSEPVREKIGGLISSGDVVLFMKGSRMMPQCGFSAQVVQILSGLLPKYKTVNVLQDPEIREGIKVFSNWPTIPQLYVRGEFVGGCDIVRDMNASGELKKLLGDLVPEPPAATEPKVSLTDAAADAIKGAIEESGGGVLVLGVDESFQTSMAIDEAPGDAFSFESSGISIAVSKQDAARANGLSIDYTSAGDQSGFRIENPNAPAEVVELTPSEAKARIDAGSFQAVFDVRTPSERDAARIEGTTLLDQAAFEDAAALDKDAPLLFHCHHGTRSRAAAQRFLQLGFRKVYNLAGGIDAWSREVDSSVPRY